MENFRIFLYDNLVRSCV